MEKGTLTGILMMFTSGAFIQEYVKYVYPKGHQHDAGPLKACNGQSPGEAVVTPITLLLATTTRLENLYENHLFIVLLSMTAYVFKNSYKCS